MTSARDRAEVNFCRMRLLPRRDPLHFHNHCPRHGRLHGCELSKQMQVRPKSAVGRVSRASPVHRAMRNCTRDGGGPFEAGSQVLASSHRKLLSSKAMVMSVAETPEQ